MNIMESQGATYHFGGGAAAGGGLMPVSAFSAYSLFRNCNYLLAPQTAGIHNKTLQPLQRLPTGDCPSIIAPDDLLTLDNEVLNLSAKPFFANTPILGYPPQLQLGSEQITDARNASALSPCSSIYASHLRRQRGEKKPIPEEQKDEKYFERRRRNNQAAKKSRDARKMREDQIALRATILEHENAILRAQVLTLREEASSLRQLLLQKKTLELSSRS